MRIHKSKLSNTPLFCVLQLLPKQTITHEQLPVQCILTCVTALHCKYSMLQWLRQEGSDWPDVLQCDGKQWPDHIIAWCRAEGCDSSLALLFAFDNGEIADEA